MQINADTSNGNDASDNKKRRIGIKNNDFFLSELLYYIKSTLENAMNIINTNNELFERSEMLGCYNLYILFTFVKEESKKIDKKLYRYIWNTQKDIPYIILYKNVILYIGGFLELYVPTITKLDPADSALCLNLYIQECDESFSIKSKSILSQCQAWYILMESKFHISLRYVCLNVCMYI
jgi:hypothetical protein